MECIFTAQWPVCPDFTQDPPSSASTRSICSQSLFYLTTLNTVHCRLSIQLFTWTFQRSNVISIAARSILFFLGPCFEIEKRNILSLEKIWYCKTTNASSVTDNKQRTDEMSSLFSGEQITTVCSYCKVTINFGICAVVIFKSSYGSQLICGWAFAGA